RGGFVALGGPAGGDRQSGIANAPPIARQVRPTPDAHGPAATQPIFPEKDRNMTARLTQGAISILPAWRARAMAAAAAVLMAASGPSMAQDAPAKPAAKPAQAQGKEMAKETAKEADPV